MALRGFAPHICPPTFAGLAVTLAGIAVLALGGPPARAASLPPSALAVALVGQDDDDDDDGMPRKGPRLPAGKELGLALTFERGGVKDTRAARMVTLDVPAGTAPTPFLAAGPFRAVWEGDLTVPFRGEYTLFAAGRGTIKVELNGKAVLTGKGDDFNKIEAKPAKLKKGPNKLVVTYDSPGRGRCSGPPGVGVGGLPPRADQHRVVHARRQAQAPR